LRSEQVRDIAEKFNMSERHINRIFKARTGECPKEYINHEKLRKLSSKRKNPTGY